MSALRQAVVLAVSLLVLQVVGAILAANVVRTYFDNRVEEDLRARFEKISSDIEQRGFHRADYQNNSAEVFYFAAEQSPAHTEPEGIFTLRGLIEDDRWDRWDWWNRAAYDPLALEDDHWYFFVGETAGSVLAIGNNLEQSSAILVSVPLIFFFIGVAISLFALTVGLAFSFYNQRRLNRISSVLQDVAQGHLASRVTVLKTRDDLDDLAQNIDLTLERLEGLFNQSRNISANLAHDLKTPIARLRLRLENALLEEDPDGVKTNVEAGLKQADHIISVFEAILSIARLESGNARKRFSLVNLADLAKEVAQTFQPVAEDAGYEFEAKISGDTVVQGDEVLLMQMLTNLIENVMRHTPVGTRISLIANATELGITDNGPGIPAGAFSEVTKPSIRLDTSRSGNGAGLGLALVKAIAEAHGAELLLSENPDKLQTGLFIRARFPLPRDAAK